MTERIYAAGMSRGARRFAVSVVTCGIALGVAISLSACAPKPMAGSHVKGEEPTSDEQSWSQVDDQNDPELKSAELPEGFPSDEFALPEGAVIDDAGQRSDRVWFAVLRATDAEQGGQWWDEIIETNDFTVRDDEQGDDGSRSATLATAQLTVSALSIPQDDGAMLLSYDITQEL